MDRSDLRDDHQAYSYRLDPAVPPFADDKPVIVFDGHCVLCSGFAQFVIRHDPQRRFRLLAAQSLLGAALYRHYGLDPVDYETNLLLADGRVWLKSEGSLRIFRLLGWPWSLLAVGRLLPLRLRDALYGVVARNRLRWFGRRDACFMPTPADADRFLQ
ncbi:MAG: thiol-disulfide oxidoreductase DCC family protein [Betaproteobacteria bacterium]